MPRLIARLDIKGQRLIKGVQYEGVRVLGDAFDVAKSYYEQGIDEIVYIDSVASLYGRPAMGELLDKTVREVFVPVTAGGGVRTVGDAAMLLGAGADKVAINTGAVQNPELISELASQYGSQCVVLSVQAKQTGASQWEVYVDCGREKTGKSVSEWVLEAEKLGAGEIFLSSIDRDGTLQGPDMGLIAMVSLSVNIPVIASSGFSSVIQISEALGSAHASAVAVGKALHSNILSISEIKESL
jgi:imidazole glycerol-phosphate synthase subunit HisF